MNLPLDVETIAPTSIFVSDWERIRIKIAGVTAISCKFTYKRQEFHSTSFIFTWFALNNWSNACIATSSSFFTNWSWIKAKRTMRPLTRFCIGRLQWRFNAKNKQLFHSYRNSVAYSWEIGLMFIWLANLRFSVSLNFFDFSFRKSYIICCNDCCASNRASWSVIESFLLKTTSLRILKGLHDYKSRAYCINTFWWEYWFSFQKIAKHSFVQIAESILDHPIV